MTVEIAKVTINLGDKTLELTPDEAKELKHILSELFGSERVVNVPQPYPVYVRPYPYGYWTVSSGTVTYGHGATGSAGNYIISLKQ